jgi:hypothetical protein
VPCTTRTRATFWFVDRFRDPFTSRRPIKLCFFDSVTWTFSRLVTGEREQGRLFPTPIPPRSAQCSRPRSGDGSAAEKMQDDGQLPRREERFGTECLMKHSLPLTFYRAVSGGPLAVINTLQFAKKGTLPLNPLLSVVHDQIDCNKQLFFRQIRADVRRQFRVAPRQATKVLWARA